MTLIPYGAGQPKLSRLHGIQPSLQCYNGLDLGKDASHWTLGASSANLKRFGKGCINSSLIGLLKCPNV